MNELELQDIINKNKENWDNEVESGGNNTIPEFDLNVDLLKQFANGELLGWSEKKGKLDNPLLKKSVSTNMPILKEKKCFVWHRGAVTNRQCFHCSVLM